jgi:SAM-dependent methyltransferase
MSETNTKFTGPVPELCDRFMVPMLFAPYAADMAAAVAALNPRAVLETAAGSGVVPRALAPLLARDARYVVTDLNPPMLERARAMQPQDARLTFQPADALDLPFEAASFDVVCCQFGVMFFPDRVKGFRAALRLLKPGGVFLFNAWDSLAENDFARTVDAEIRAFYPANPPDFFARTPHGYHDPGQIRADLAGAGFGKVSLRHVAHASPAASARDAATAYCQGTPMRMEIAARGEADLVPVTDRVAAALTARFGAGPITGKMQALVVEARA